MQFKFLRDPDGRLHCQAGHAVNSTMVKEAFINFYEEGDADKGRNFRKGTTSLGEKLFIVFEWVSFPDKVFIITAYEIYE